jgi:catechol 2,3-dioxygenase-like lactoylglutathione lyase family enzyme
MALMAARLLDVAFDAHDPARVAEFWAGMLGRQVIQDGGAALLPGEQTQLGLRFLPSVTEKLGQNPMHLHLTSATPAAQQRTVATALRLGGSHLDLGQPSDAGYVVLADPEGNEFCVIEAGNAYLAGCGFLGELTCNGTRAVGLFWSQVLDWPLVWDREQETAVQSRAGGTKVSWGGEPASPNASRNRQRLDLAPVDRDPAAEADRLVSLGASRLELGADGVVMLADPDGNPFRLIAGQRVG